MKDPQTTKPKRIITIYFWTQKQLDEAKASADRLFNFFKKSPNIRLSDHQ